MPGPFNFDARAKLVLALGQNEAIHLNHDYIGPEHLLLGLVREGDSTAAKVLSSLGVEIAKARTAVELISGRGDAEKLPEIVLSPETTKVLELARDEARKLGGDRIAPEHLLIGIVRAPGRAEAVLRGLGLSLELIGKKVTEALGRSDG